jgi:proline racemase
MLEQHDHLHWILMFEPRGHSDTYGATMTSPITPDYRIVFMHNKGYSTILVETGQVAAPGRMARIGSDTTLS